MFSLDRDLKVVILGTSGVGKTCFVQRYLRGQFIANTAEHTIGAAFSVKQWGRYKVAIWDTAGEERFRALSSFYSRDASAAILAYSIVDKRSFDDLQRDFLHLLDQAKDNCLVAVVGTKSDLVNKEGRKVDYEVGQAMAKRENLKRNNYFSNEDEASVTFFETSSKTGENVIEVFQFLEKTLLLRLKGLEPEPESNILTAKSGNTQGGCCK